MARVNGLGASLPARSPSPPPAAPSSTVRAQVQEYTSPYDQYCDLADLCALLVARRGPVSGARGCGARRSRRAVIAAGAKGTPVAHSDGVSVYFPKKTVSSLYATLDFSKRGRWASFLDDYTGA